MELIDIIVIAIIVLIIGGASAYIIKAKKSGKKCIGCPDSCSCNTNKKAEKGGSFCSSCSSCSCCSGYCDTEETEDTNTDNR